MRFGPAGIPIGLKKGGTKEGIGFTAGLGLTAFEVEFVRGVKMKAEYAKEVGKTAKEKDILLSAHCPYWINTCAMTKEKLNTSKRNILTTAKIASEMGAIVIVFHPGFYMGRSSEECMEISLKTLLEVKEEMKSRKWNVLLGAETTGKASQFGSLDEVIEIAREIGGVPVIDFAHVHARHGKGELRKKEDFKKIFDKIEKSLGSKAVKNFHSHFSEINYSKKGELNHIPIGMNDEPPFKPLAEVIVENGYDGTIICESPFLEEDAIKMKIIYEKIIEKKK